MQFPRPPVPAPQPQEQTAQPPFAAQQPNAGYPGMNPFGFGAVPQNRTATPNAANAAPAGQPANPMFMDGYRNILEQLLGGIGQRPGAQPAANPFDPYPQQQQQNRNIHNHAHGHVLGGLPQPVPQPNVPGRTSRFRYTMTTIGPDGRMQTVTNESDNPLDNPMMAGGRQIPVPTLDDFLGMHHGPPGGAVPNGERNEREYGYGPLGMMLRQFMEGMGPVHGQRGDYLPMVRPSSVHSDFRECRWMISSPNSWNRDKDRLPRHQQQRMRWIHYRDSKRRNLSLKEEKNVQFAKTILKLGSMSLDYPVYTYCTAPFHT
jgi:hypothetical protein